MLPFDPTVSYNLYTVGVQAVGCAKYLADSLATNAFLFLSGALASAPSHSHCEPHQVTM